MKITEKELKQIVAESVKKVLNEEIDTGHVSSSEERKNRYNESLMSNNVRYGLRLYRSLINCYNEINVIARKEILDIDTIYSEMDKLENLL